MFTGSRSGGYSGVSRGREMKPGGNPSGGKEPSGGSSGSRRAPNVVSPGVTPTIPSDLSFVFRIESLRPNYENQTRRMTSTGAWAPPTVQNAYYTVSDTFWRWQGGRVTSIPAGDPTLRAGLQRIKVASLFSQDPDTPHLLVVPFDVRMRNVQDYGRGWLPITFDHISIGSASGVRNYYSSVSHIGDETHIAAPGQSFWMPQLLPSWYNYRAPSSPPSRTHIGLIGNLPILLALAVFSAPATNLTEAMGSLRPGAWSPHRHQYPSGLIPGERGIVITVFLDPLNPDHSTRGLLEHLEEGDFGPFYGRHPAPAPASSSTSVSYTGVSSGYPGRSAAPSAGPSAGRYRLP